VRKQKPKESRTNIIYTTKQLKKWAQIISRNLSPLSYPQAFVLAMWSMGMVIAQSCGLSRVSRQLAEATGQKEGAVRQRLREWNWEKGAKVGQKRRELDVRLCFPFLLKWVLNWWGAEERRLALALDASSLGVAFVVLSLSVVYRGCAIPVAWKVLKAEEKGAWKAEWLGLLASLAHAIPADWQVIVLADRGLYAHWLFTAIQHLGWHPFLRINLGGKFCPDGTDHFLPLDLFVSKEGQAWARRGTCFKTHPIRATLLTYWDARHQAPWLIVTDLDPGQAQIAWYGMRSWIENGFRSTKRGGWQWQNTRMTDPARATRFWLALAVATLWVVSVGGEADDHLPACSLQNLPPNHIARRLSKGSQKHRFLSCFRQGIQVILASLINHTPLPVGSFRPEPWPS
jgi:hypothetical protein